MTAEPRDVEEIRTLRQAIDSASPLPWVKHDDAMMHIARVWPNNVAVIATMRDIEAGPMGARSSANRDLIVAAVNALPALLARLAAADQENAELRGEVERLTRERDAYRKAKAENDERFMLERDEARAQLAAAQAQLAEALTLLADAIPDPKGAIDSARWHRRMDALSAALSAAPQPEPDMSEHYFATLLATTDDPDEKARIEAQRQKHRAQPEPAGLDEPAPIACTCTPCVTPGNGGPTPGHCAACCGLTGIEEYNPACPVVDHREMALRQFGAASDEPARCEHGRTGPHNYRRPASVLLNVCPGPKDGSR